MGNCAIENYTLEFLCNYRKNLSKSLEGVNADHSRKYTFARLTGRCVNAGTSRQFLLLSSALVLSLTELTSMVYTATAENSQTVPPWKVENNKGINQEHAKKYPAAITYFQRSLNLLPATALSERVDVQCQIAIDYLRMQQTEKALPIIDQMLQDFKKLRAKGAVSADTEMSVRALVEEFDNTQLKVMNLKTWKERLEQSDRICRIALPYDIKRRANNIRGFLGMGSPAEALKYSEKCLNEMSPRDDKYLSFKTNVAALKKLLKQPQMLRDVMAQLRKTQTPAQVACAVAKAQTWATDYVGCDQTLAACELELTRAKRLTQADLIHLNHSRLCNALDRGAWAYGETLSRRMLTYKLDENMRNSFLTGLAECLRRQNKGKEAAALKAEARSQYDFLADDERAAAEESRVRRERERR